jgi:hypothetical protein
VGVTALAEVRVAADRGMPQFWIKQLRQPYRAAHFSERQNMVDQDVIDRLEGVYDR